MFYVAVCVSSVNGTRGPCVHVGQRVRPCVSKLQHAIETYIQTQDSLCTFYIPVPSGLVFKPESTPKCGNWWLWSTYDSRFTWLVCSLKVTVPMKDTLCGPAVCRPLRAMREGLLGPCTGSSSDFSSDGLTCGSPGIARGN